MNVLLSGFPETVTVEGAEYAVNTDHRTWIGFDIMMSDPEIPPQEKFVKLLSLCYKDALPPTAQGALAGAIEFYSCAEKDKCAAEGEKRGKRIFSFEHDARYIYAAFLSEYNIDLSVESLHWWQFNALFQSLGEENKICKIMEYRSVDLSKVGKEQKPFYRKMKAYYRLPDMRSQEEKDEDIAKSLAGFFS